jgi:hypothetical protein
MGDTPDPPICTVVASNPTVEWSVQIRVICVLPLVARYWRGDTSGPAQGNLACASGALLPGSLCMYPRAATA